MTFFEQELRKIVGDVYPDATFVGRACYVRLSDMNRAKIQFTTCGTADHCEALQMTILNRSDGQVDTLRLRFKDVLGTKAVPNNPNFRNGIMPGPITARRNGMATIPTAGTMKSSRTPCPTIWMYFRSRPRPLTSSGSRPCDD